MKSLRPLFRSVRAWWRGSESATVKGDSYSIVRGLQPAFSNRAFLLYFFPIPVVISVAAFLVNGSWAPFVLILAIWILAGFLYFASLSFGWYRRSRHVAAQLEKAQSSRQLLSVHLSNRFRRDPNIFEYSKWDEKVVADTDGNAKVVRTISLIVGDSDTPAVWSGRSSEQDVQDTDSVEVSAVQRLVGGRVRPVDTDVVWDGNRHHEVYLHPEGGLKAGQSATFEITWKWPELLKKLVVDGKREPIGIKFSRTCAHLTFTYIIHCRKGIEYDADEIPGATVDVGRKGNHQIIKIDVESIEPGSAFGGGIYRTRK